MKLTATGGRRIDWKTERERVDLAAVVTRLLGPAPGRRGERGRKLWWSCPLGTHEDRNPSFVVEPGNGWWKCFGCGESGDAAALVMRLEGRTFPEAVAYLTGGPAPTGKAKPRPRPEASRKATTPAEPSGMPEADALALVEATTSRLWSPEGADALAYLTGPDRCLTLATIRAARLGVTSWVTVPKADGTTFQALGVVVPWFASGRLTMVKIRQPEGRRPRYVEVFRDPARLVCYPGADVIRPGRPLIIVEGEFDALVLGEALGELAAVVTLGSAAARPEVRALGMMLAAPRWFIATDRDDAGDKAADDWPARARRVRPPAPFKDWTEAKAGPREPPGARTGGVNLARWWGDILAGIDRPALYTWDDLSRWRWGPADGDSTPGIDNPGRPFNPESFPQATAAPGDGPPSEPAADDSTPAIPDLDAHTPDGVCGKII
jgi:CHC2 zinc finger/Toprim-like